VSKSLTEVLTRGWMAVVAASALVLVGLRWPVLAGVMAILVLFAPILAECYKAVQRLKSSFGSEPRDPDAHAPPT
jgi:hypothetical protein